MLKRLAGAAFAAALIIPAASAAAGDFYVVLGSFADASGMAAVEAGEKLMKRGRRCGFDVWTETSSKIKGFAPGYYVALTGPYQSAEAAEMVRARIMPCAPDAYVKGGKHLGE